jgi:hypothetical protein
VSRVALIAAIAAAGVSLQSGNAQAGATLAAEYLFNNTLNSDVAGAPALTAVDPQSQSGFVTDTVFGTSQIVYNFQSTPASPAEQAGLTLATNGLIASNDYSVQMIFKLTGRDNAWRRLIDSLNRTSDSGFYFDPSNQLNIYPVISGGPTYATDTYDNIALTVAADGNVDAYLNGIEEFTVNTDVMNISADNLLGFFLDNTVAGGQGEWSAGSVAALRVYDGVLTQDQVTALNNVTSPTAPQPPTGAPEPATLALLMTGLSGIALLRRKRAAV